MKIVNAESYVVEECSKDEILNTISLNTTNTVSYYYVTYAFQSEFTLHGLAKWLSVRLRIKWWWVRIPLLSLKLQISVLF